MTKTNRELIEEELSDVLTTLSTQNSEIRASDAAIREQRTGAAESRKTAQNLRMALFALAGDSSKTVEDADAANDAVLSSMEVDHA